MIHLTDKAVEKIKESMRKNNASEDVGGVSFGLKGGGCAGFRYFFKWKASSEPGDTVFEHNGAKLFVDEESLKFVDGSSIDWGWVDHLMAEGFKIENPNVESSCGCGVSVSPLM